MMSTDTVEGRRSGVRDQDSKGPILDELGGLREKLRSVLDEDISPFRKGEKKCSTTPEIKGLKILKDGGYDVDLEKTIDDMFVVTKNMEFQLQRVMGINSMLEKELNEYKEIVAEQRASKEQLEGKIARLEEEMPAKREIQIEIEHLEEERNSAQKTIHDLKSKLEKTKEALSDYQEKVHYLGDERKDAVSEAYFLEAQLNSATQGVIEKESRIVRLKGESLAQREKIGALEKELGETIEEKHRLKKELKETKEAMNKFRQALTKSKLEAKRSFYKRDAAKES